MLYETIEQQDKLKTLTLVMQLKEQMRSDPEAVKWVADPVNLKELHEKLTLHLGVPSKAMMIKNRIPHRQRRAFTFIEAVENGVRRVL